MTSINRNRSKYCSKKSKTSIETDEQIDKINSKLYEDEKAKYKSDLELVKHSLFRDFNDTVYKSPTAYRIFLNEKLPEGFDQGLDPKDVQKEVGNTWE